MKKIFAIIISLLSVGCAVGYGRPPALTPARETYRDYAIYETSPAPERALAYTPPTQTAVQTSSLPAVESRPVTATVAPSVNASKATTHTVIKGDTAYSVAKKYGMDKDELARLNGLDANYTLSIGQVLKLRGVASSSPSATSAKPAPAKEAPTLQIVEPKRDYIIIAPKDTVYSLSKKHNVVMNDLIAKNALKPPYILTPGQKLYFPDEAFHVVKAKETVYSISRQYGVDLSELVKLNGIEAPYIISIGQKIALPATTSGQSIVPQKAVTTSIASTKPTTTSIAVKPVPTATTTPATKPAASQKTAAEKAKAKQEFVKVVQPAPKRAGKKFAWPIKGSIISKFGPVGNSGLSNDGINIAGITGDAVKAAENGTVAYAGNELKGLGNLILLKHADNYMTIYAHNNKILVKRGDTVKRGEKIAEVGTSGNVQSPQLHFEIRHATKAQDPLKLLE